MGRKLEQTLAVLNGLVGDYLSRTGNGLATDMGCYRGGQPVALDRERFARVHPDAKPRVAVLVHGVMCTEGIWTLPDGSDYGSLLARDLGFTPLYVRYNSGLAIADSGAQLAALLQAVVSAYPLEIEELLLIGYSMGGLVIRSACHAAQPAAHDWLSRVRRIIYVGTPHLGAPAERIGRTVARILGAVDDPYTRLIAEIADLRSSGLKDLGNADLRHEDRTRKRSLAWFRDRSHPLPLLASIRHHLIAGSIADPRLAFLFGDSIVPVDSATYGGIAAAACELLPEEQVKLLSGVSHLELAHHPAVYAQIKAWSEPTP